MKGSFKKDLHTMKLDETLKKREPYAILAVSTTGLDLKDFADHSPTRVVLKEYEYDAEIKGYAVRYTFDEMVKASDEAIKKALANTDYDAFENGGIDKDAYQRGEGVLSQAQFLAKFKEAMGILQSDNALLIANNLEHATKYLDKIGAANEIKDMSVKGKTLDQASLTKEYLKTNKGFLEDLKAALRTHPKNSFMTNIALMQDFTSMSKDDFLKAHKDISESSYETTRKDAAVDAAVRGQKIIGGNARIDVINHYITKHGEEAKIFVSGYQRHLSESEAAKREELSAEGKEDYQKKNVSEKLSFLVEKEIVNPDEIEAKNDEFHKLIAALEDPKNKGVTVIHAASTGFDRRQPSPAYFGEPIRFTAVTFFRDDKGKINFSSKPEGTDMIIEASKRALANAEKNITDPKYPYDTFAEAGIDLKEYKNRTGVLAQDEAIAKVNAYFSKFPTSEYPVIAIGQATGPDRKRIDGKSFAQMSMLNLGGLDICKATSIDAMQAVKDYTYIAENDDAYPENVLFDPQKLTGNFGLESIAKARESEPLNSTYKKCYFVIEMLEAIDQQQEELFRHPVQAKQQTVQAINVQPDIGDFGQDIGSAGGAGHADGQLKDGNGIGSAGGSGGTGNAAQTSMTGTPSRTDDTKQGIPLAAFASKPASYKDAADNDEIPDDFFIFADDEEGYSDVMTDAERPKTEEELEQEAVEEYLRENMEEDAISENELESLVRKTINEPSDKPAPSADNPKIGSIHPDRETDRVSENGRRYIQSPERKEPVSEPRPVRRRDETVQTPRHVPDRTPILDRVPERPDRSSVSDRVTDRTPSSSSPAPRRRIIANDNPRVTPEQPAPAVSNEMNSTIEKLTATIEKQGEQIATLIQTVTDSTTRYSEMADKMMGMFEALASSQAQSQKMVEKLEAMTAKYVEKAEESITLRETNLALREENNRLHKEVEEAEAPRRDDLSRRTVSTTRGDS